MRQVVSFVCEKGGVGKTALADELRYHYERAGVAVSMYSLDGQYVSRSHKVDDPRIVILDTAGTLDEKVQDVIGKSDLIVVPVRPSFNDIEPFTRSIELIKTVAPDAQVLIVVNAYTQFTMSKQFMEWLRSKDYGYPVVYVPQSEYLAQSIGSGHSVVGHDRYGAASRKIMMFCDTVAHMLEFGCAPSY